MEIGYSSVEVTLSVTGSRKLPLALPQQSEDFYQEKNRKGGHNATELSPERTETSLHLALVCLLDFISIKVVVGMRFSCASSSYDSLHYHN